MKVALAVMPETPALTPLITSTSMLEPVGGVITLASLTPGRVVAASLSCGQVTVELIWMLFVSEAVSVTLQPLVSFPGFPGGFGFLGDREEGAADDAGVFVGARLEGVEGAGGLAAQLLLGLGGEDRGLVVAPLVGGEFGRRRRGR